MTKSKPGRGKRILFGVCALAASSLIAALAVEVAFRLLPYMVRHDYGYLTPLPPSGSPYFDGIYQASSTPGLLMELAPGQTKWEKNGSVYHINELGMRDDLPMEAGDGSLVRVAVLGDSFAFGYGVNQEEVFTTLLEKCLNERAPAGVRFDVMNFAAPSYAAQHQPPILEHKVLPWKPDLVVLTYVVNDPETDPIQWPQRNFAPIRPWQRSAIMRAVFQIENRMDVARLGGGDYTRYLHAKGEAKWSSVERAFADIARIGRENDFPVLLLMFPELNVDSWDAYPYRDIHDQVRGEGEKNGFAWFDALRAWSGSTPPRDFMVAADDAHPDARAHALLADALCGEVPGLLAGAGE